jgi:hypothetical protein
MVQNDGSHALQDVIANLQMLVLQHACYKIIGVVSLYIGMPSYHADSVSVVYSGPKNN